MCLVIKFSIHARVKRGVGVPSRDQDVAEKPSAPEWLGEAERAHIVESVKSRVSNASGKVMSSNETVVHGIERLKWGPSKGRSHQTHYREPPATQMADIDARGS